MYLLICYVKLSSSFTLQKRSSERDAEIHISEPSELPLPPRAGARIITQQQQSIRGGHGVHQQETTKDREATIIRGRTMKNSLSWIGSCTTRGIECISPAATATSADPYRIHAGLKNKKPSSASTSSPTSSPESKSHGKDTQVFLHSHHHPIGESESEHTSSHVVGSSKNGNGGDNSSSHHHHHQSAQVQRQSSSMRRFTRQLSNTPFFHRTIMHGRKTKERLQAESKIVNKASKNEE